MKGVSFALGALVHGFVRFPLSLVLHLHHVASFVYQHTTFPSQNYVLCTNKSVPFLATNSIATFS
jgi:hypothetical protein